MSAYLYYPLAAGMLAYLLYVLYTIVRPELSRIKAAPIRQVTDNERALFPNADHPDNQVYKVKGPVFLGVTLGAGNTNIETKLWDFKIGQYSFENAKVAPDYKATAENLHAGQIIAVEFSMKSKFVWKIELIQM